MAGNVIIAPQLFSCLAKLTANEKARVIDFISTFQQNPANPAVSLERVKGARSPDVWSGRVSGELRAILHKEGDTWAILYSDHHDGAYEWAMRRDIGRHSVTGALQIVESVEMVREVERVIEVPVQPEARPLFQGHDDAYLLSLGVPEQWLPTLRRVRDDDQLLIVCESLTDDVAERLIALASGDFVTPPPPLPFDRPVIDAPDTRRRFYLVEDSEGLLAALEAPLERWIAFLHPSQRRLVERDFSGPAKVSGSAGTGKTVVAMHRARYLARNGERVLLTSYVTTLCENIDRNLQMLCTTTEREAITVSTVHKQALDVVRSVQPAVRPAADREVWDIMENLRIRHAPEHTTRFLRAEWDHVVRMQGIGSWDEYRSARRSGRGRGLGVRERRRLWTVFGGTLEALESRRLFDWSGLCRLACALLEEGVATSPYTAVIVDEVQDLRPPEILFLKALCSESPGNLMLCGDTGQRIYPGGFSLSALGVEVRGRATVLRVNYRTTEQIRKVADRMVGDVSDDMEGGEERRAGARSLLRGPEPRLVGNDSHDDELAAAVQTVQSWLSTGVGADEMGAFARTGSRVDELGAALVAAGISWRRLSGTGTPGSEEVQVGTMHRAKGLEFKAVLVFGCSDNELPNRAAIRGVDDPHDRDAAEARERRLLYVAMTRARDELTVSWTATPSRFLAPLLESTKVSS